MAEKDTIVDLGVHDDCGHATEAHGPTGCVQSGCLCEVARIPEGYDGANPKEDVTVIAPTAAASGQR